MKEKNILDTHQVVEINPGGVMRLLRQTILTCLVCMSCAANAGDLIVGGTITKISNTSSNLQNFAILVSGGSTNLCGSAWINFPVSAVADVESHKRAYAIALVALTTGLTVRVHNYVDNTCNTAAYIELSVP